MSSSPTSGRSTPPTSSPPSTSAARSAPTRREWSLRQLIDRVVHTYRAAGEENGYFALGRRRRGLRARADLDAAAPGVQLQLAGLVQRRHDVAAAGHRLLHPRRRRHDGLDPELVPRRGPDLQGRLRRRAEPVPHPVVEGAAVLRRHRLRPGVSFMRGADASAGTIKSGGATRRAAKMVVLDVDHPDIEEFVETKAREEDKIRALRDAGFDMDLGGTDIMSVQYQNANNSVRVTDEFMRAVEDGSEFGLRARGPTRSSRRRRRRSCSARSPRRRGSAPTPASSTTTRSTTGTPTRRPAGSPRPTRARST